MGSSRLPRRCETWILVTSGLGAVYLLRWFWWRLTAWGEIGGMIVAPLAAFACKGAQVPYARSALLVTGATVCAAWPDFRVGSSEQTCVTWRRLQPAVGPAGWWGPLAQRGGPARGRWLLLRFLAGNAILFGLTFAVGGLLLQKGPGVVVGNLVALGIGIAVDRYARQRLASFPPDPHSGGIESLHG